MMKNVMIAFVTAFAIAMCAGMSMAGPFRGHDLRG